MITVVLGSWLMSQRNSFYSFLLLYFDVDIDNSSMADLFSNSNLHLSVQQEYESWLRNLDLRLPNAPPSPFKPHQP